MITKEFIAFLREYNIISLAVAFIMGAASTTLVSSLVKDIVMPLVAPLFSSDSWREATLTLGSVHIAYGSFLAELINFIILAFIVFLIAKKILKIEKIN
jgi:large conductance mechanosensitive channel